MIKNNKEIDNILRSSINFMRKYMSLEDYINYLFGLVFFKFLSDQLLIKSSEILNKYTLDLNRAQLIYEESCRDKYSEQLLLSHLSQELHYTLAPQLTFTSILHRHYSSENGLNDIGRALKEIEQSNEYFRNIFEDFDVNSNKLGSTIQEKNETLNHFFDIVYYIESRTKSPAYLFEYLIEFFAKNSKEFHYTPKSVSKIMSQIIFDRQENQETYSIYDPTMGTGSLILDAGKYQKNINYFGQEQNVSRYNLARMNAIIHKIPLDKQCFKNESPLDLNATTLRNLEFDSIVMNPPFSVNWSADADFLLDSRFKEYGVLPPKSKADFSFLLHGYYYLKATGVMCIILPHGILFRGGAEGKIRKQLLELGAIDTIIGLPSRIFYDTSIPTVLIILKKENRKKRDVLFVDASKKFIKEKTQNYISDEYVEQIVRAYKKRENKEKFSYVATFQEIKENDFNLNIPRYVDTFEEYSFDLNELLRETMELNNRISKDKSEFIKTFDELISSEDKYVQQELNIPFNILKKIIN